jgi:hypothetical protein
VNAKVPKIVERIPALNERMNVARNVT